jgi:hypothetical protein
MKPDMMIFMLYISRSFLAYPNLLGTKGYVVVVVVVVVVCISRSFLVVEKLSF